MLNTGEIVNVFIAIALFEGVIRTIDWYLNRKPDLKCDGCGEVKKLYKIRGRSLYYCHKCRNRYKQDQKNSEVIYSVNN